jgi:spoIIIJ-associated protein
METYEFEGKNTEEAIQNASRELDLPVEELNIDVIEPGSAGIFGLVGGKKAKIKVSVKTSPEPETAHEAAHGAAHETAHKAAVETEDAKVAKGVLEKILSLVPIEATVETGRLDEGRINLTISGDSSGLLIGRKGKTLDALQFIVNKIVSKALDKKLEVVIDSEDYRKRREDSLIQLAKDMGDKVKRGKKAVTTAPLNPHDRRIVHLTLKDDPEVETKSRGEGLLKRVVIVPKHRER